MSAAATAAPPTPRATANGAAAPARPRRKRMLIIVNPYATTVSDRLKNLVVYALQARYEVEAISTQARNHATEIGREARDGGYDVVVAFGGDGTLNEVANGLAGTGVPLSVLPGGSTNVVCRTLGIPDDVVDATEHLLGLADDFRPRQVDLGIANGRRFVFACGMGIDATVVRRVDAHPRMKARAGEWYYTWAAVTGFNRHYVFGRPPRLRMTCEAGEVEGTTAITQNSDPFTYFGQRAVRVCEGAALDNGTLSLAVLKRAALRDMPTVMARCLSSRFPAVNHRQIEHFAGVRAARVVSLPRPGEGEAAPVPLQVDGDFIGEFTELEIGIDPDALTIVA